MPEDHHAGGLSSSNGSIDDFMSGVSERVLILSLILPPADQASCYRRSYHASKS
jgi:hypothetical protein